MQNNLPPGWQDKGQGSASAVFSPHLQQQTPQQQPPPYQQPGFQQGFQQPVQQGFQQPYQQPVQQGLQQPYQQQPYQQAPVQPGKFMTQPGYTDGAQPPGSPLPNGDPSKMFKSEEWRDLWAAVLYYLQVGGVLLVLIMYAQYIPIIMRDQAEIKDTPGWSDKYLAAFIIAPLSTAFLFTWGYLSLLRAVPESIITIALSASVAIPLICGVVLACIPETMVAGIVIIALALFNGLLYFLWRKKIPFSALLLRTTVEVFEKYPNVWALGLIMAAAQTFFILLQIFASFGVLGYVKTTVKDDYTGEIVCGCFLAFSMYWNLQVVENVIHTTVAGVIASYYFLSTATQDAANPVWSCLRRSLTLSFGSICLGSLLVALVQMMRFLLKSAAGGDRKNLVTVLAECFLNLIESLMRYINFYAFVHVAIYGKPFFASAKSAWRLITERGIDVIINDSLVGTTMNLSVLFIGLLNGAIAFGVAFIFFKNEFMHLSVIAAVYAFLIAFLVSAVALQLVTSASSSTLVCFAEKPEAIQATKPALFNEMQQKCNVAIL